MQPVEPALLAVGVTIILAAGFIAARVISSWASWMPAGPLALVAAAPVIPRIPLFLGLSTDDLLPLLGLAILVWRSPIPQVPRGWVVRGVLLAIAIATLARVASALANGGGPEGSTAMLVKGIARPVLLLGIVGYVAAAAPEGVRRRFAAILIASVGTFEAAFGLLAFVTPLPSHAGIEAARQLTDLYGVCPGRISGTLGLSPNHLGAVFVLTVPLTLGLAVTHTGWRQWAWAVAGVGQAAALVLTFTRSSILLGVVMTIAFLLYERRFILLVAVSAGVIGLVLAALSLGCTAASGGSSGGSGHPSTGPGSIVGGRFLDGNDRLALWYSSSRIMLDYPLFGVGLGQTGDTLAANPQVYRETPFGPATSSAHNTILLAGAETGVVGGLAVLGINIGLGLVALRSAWRGRKRDGALLLAGALSVGGYLAQGMVNNLFEVGATSALFALTVGAFGASYQSTTSTQAVRPYTSPATDDRAPDGDR